MEKILIIKCGALGDMLASVPAIRSVRENYPKAHITLLINKNSIVKKGFLVDEIINKNDYKSLDLIKKVRSAKYDAVVNLKFPSELALMITILSGAKRKVGNLKLQVANKLLKIPNFAYTKVPEEDSKEQYRHEYLKNLDIAALITEGKTTTKGYLEIDKNALEKATKFVQTNFGDTPFVIASPGASTLTKAWPKEKYIDFLNTIGKKHGIKFLITYDKKDEHYSKEIYEKTKEHSSFAYQTSLEDIFALTSLSSFVVTNNTGLIHIAYNLNIPVMCFNTTVLWAPFGKDDITLSNYRMVNGELAADGINEKLLSFLFRHVKKILKLENKEENTETLVSKIPLTDAIEAFQKRALEKIK